MEAPVTSQSRISLPDPSFIPWRRRARDASPSRKAKCRRQPKEVLENTRLRQEQDDIDWFGTCIESRHSKENNYRRESSTIYKNVMYVNMKRLCQQMDFNMNWLSINFITNNSSPHTTQTICLDEKLFQDF